MPIPTAFDSKLAKVSIAGEGIVGHLRTMQHAAARDLPTMRERLREMLQDYVDAAMSTARDAR